MTGYLFGDVVLALIFAPLIAVAIHHGVLRFAEWLRPDVYRSPFGDVPNLPPLDPDKPF